MKRSITRWTTALATAALLGLPASAIAQEQPAPQQQPAPQPQPPTPAPNPQPQQPAPTPQPQPTPTPTPQPTDPQPAQPQQPPATAPTPAASAKSPMPKTDQVSAEEHLRQAQAALNDIKTTSVPARNRNQLAQLKRHLAALEQGAPAATPAPRSTRGTAASANANWGTEVAAIDKILTEMVGSDTPTATTGTTGAPASGTPSGTAGKSKAATAIAIDDATRAKLMEVRTHITAYATARAAAPSTPKTDAAMSEQPSSAPAANAATPSASPEAAAAQQPSPADPAAAANPASASQPQIDAEAARRHLTEARDTLAQLTKLPAAAQLTGEARTQVTQLISNFNELITTQTNWRASYAKVAANLSAILGPDNTDAEAAGGAPTAATGTTGTPGAVGTSGAATVEIDPAVRAKLVELRRNLDQFQKASGGIDK